MRNTVNRLLPLYVSSIFACQGSGEGPTGPALEVAIAPLSLSDITEACYNLTTTNEAGGAGQVVWTRTRVCSSQFGDSRGAVTYVGTCDASPEGRINSVTLELASLSDKAKEELSSPKDFVNPCPPGEDRCVLDVACRANADTLVAFDLTVLRNAQQGFFDVAVNFEDIFCSSKIDCTYDEEGNDPIKLLFDAKGNRSQSVVVALACTSGPGEDEGTVLHVNGPRVVCGEEVRQRQVDVSLATTCIRTGEIIGFGATMGVSDDEPDVVAINPLVARPDGNGGYNTSALPYQGAFPNAFGAIVLGRLDDLHVAGYIFDGGADSDNGLSGAHLAIWRRAPDASWSLISTAPTGGSFAFGDGFAFDAENGRLWFGVRGANGGLKSATIDANFNIGPVWSPVPPPGTDSCRPFGLSGAQFVFGCYDSATQTGDTGPFVLQVLRMDTMTEITPPGLGPVGEAYSMCGDRLLVEVEELGVTVLREYRMSGGTWSDSVFATAYDEVDIAFESILSLKALDGSVTLWNGEPGGAWSSAQQPATGRTYDFDYVRFSDRALVGIATGANGEQPVLAALDPQAPGTWHEQLLPLPTECDGRPFNLKGAALREGRAPHLVAQCRDTSGDGPDVEVLWEIGEVDGRVAVTAWRYSVQPRVRDLIGILTRQGLDDGLSATAQTWPNCDPLIGAAQTNETIHMALWNVDGTSSGTSLPPEFIPLQAGPSGSGEAPGGDSGGTTSYSLEIDPTFEGNLWFPPRSDEPVFQVGSYHGKESLLCNGQPCNKVYWNVVVGFDPSTPDCWLEWEATASAAPGLVEGQTRKGTVYPFLRGQVQLTSGAKEGAEPTLLCRKNPVNGGGGLGTEYTSPSETHTFCHGTDGEAMWSVDGCIWDGVGGGRDEGGGDKDDPPAEPDGPEGVGIGSGTITTSEGAQTVNVTITNDFWIGRYEVTRGEWKALSGGLDPSGFQTQCEGDNCPMNLVSWWSALGYLNALSMAEGYEPCYLIGTFATVENPFVPAPEECSGTWQDGSLVCTGSPTINGATVFNCEGYRLPTEGEWELAARAGTTTRTYGGDPSATSGCVTLSGAGSFPAGTPLGDLAWYDCNSEGRTHKVGTLAANSQGLYDMLGNVWEWVHDWYGPYNGSNLVDSTGPTTGEDRIRRGGGYSTPAENVSSPGRGRAAPWVQSLTTGFRATRSLGPQSGN